MPWSRLCESPQSKESPIEMRDLLATIRDVMRAAARRAAEPLPEERKRIPNSRELSCTEALFLRVWHLYLGVHIRPPLLPERHLPPELVEPVEVQLGADKSSGVDVLLVRRVVWRAGRRLRDDRAPWVDNHGMPVGLTLRRVFADLCGGEDVRLRLDCARAEKDLCRRTDRRSSFTVSNDGFCSGRSRVAPSCKSTAPRANAQVNKILLNSPQ